MLSMKPLLFAELKIDLRLSDIPLLAFINPLSVRRESQGSQSGAGAKMGLDTRQGHCQDNRGWHRRC